MATTQTSRVQQPHQRQVLIHHFLLILGGGLFRYARYIRKTVDHVSKCKEFRALAGVIYFPPFFYSPSTPSRSADL